MQTLKKFVSPRGALSAAARHLVVNPATVLRWSIGEWTPSASAQQRIDAMLSTMIFDVAAKSLKKLTEHSSEVTAARKSHNGTLAAK